MRKVAIMQPTYLPWCGYFALMSRVDLFVFLDSVQFERRSWQQRNRIKGPQGEILLTVPVQKAPRDKLCICDAKIDCSSRFVQKHTSAIQHAYGKAPFYRDYKNILIKNIQTKNDLLADLNITLIREIAQIIGIKTETVRSTELNTNGSKDELLYNICKEIGADAYISPLGSKSYLKDSLYFGESTVKLFYHHYCPLPYNQLFGDFIPYLSILDMLFNEGDNCYNIITSGIRNEMIG